MTDQAEQGGVMESPSERVRAYGRQAAVLAEMLQLGFWPAGPEAAHKRERALAELAALHDNLIGLRESLAEVEENLVAEVDAILEDLRGQRIRRTRDERARCKQEKHASSLRLTLDQELRRQRLLFLGHGVSAGLRYEGGDSARVAALGLPALSSAADIATAIGMNTETLAWLTYHRGAATVDHYHRFTIPKRGGGRRPISSPKRTLRLAQGWVLRAILSGLPLHDAAMAFRSGRSIVDNARLHQGRALVIRIDLKDFFPSITFARAKGLFASFGYSEGVATILALLCTEAPRAAVTLDGARYYVAIGERRLPQGACTSPAITNILCRGLDARLAGLARHFGYTYSRYADDLVFSHPAASATLGAFLRFVHEVIAQAGFTVNTEKTRVMRPQHRQSVNGLVVNGTAADPDRSTQPRLSRTDLRRFRSFLHHCETEGLETVSARLGGSARAYARGYLAFIHMASPERAARIAAAHPWLHEHT